MQSRLEEIRQTGTEVLAVSVNPAATTRDKLDSARLEFPLLSDPDLEAIDAYGVRHPGGGMGMGGHDVARPATFLIDRQGRVVWRELTDNWRIRLRPERLLDQLATAP